MAKHGKQWVKADRIEVVDPIYMEEEYYHDEDVEYYKRQIEMHGSIKPEGHVDIDDIYNMASDLIDKY